jgi:hypothetical protein
MEMEVKQMMELLKAIQEMMEPSEQMMLEMEANVSA